MAATKRSKTQMAERLIRYRSASGLTQERVASVLGIKRSTYGYYEIDVCPPISILKKLANMYNVTIDEITGEYPAWNPENELRSDIYRAAQPEVMEYGTTLMQQSTDERELLMLYRILPKDTKARVKDIVKDLANQLEN